MFVDTGYFVWWSGFSQLPVCKQPFSAAVHLLSHLEPLHQQRLSAEFCSTVANQLSFWTACTQPWLPMWIFPLFFILACALALKMASHWLSAFISFHSVPRPLNHSICQGYRWKNHETVTIGDGLHLEPVVNRAGFGIKHTEAYVLKLDHELRLTFLPTDVRSFQYMVAIVIFLLCKHSTEMWTISTLLDALYQVPDTEILA